MAMLMQRYGVLMVAASVILAGCGERETVQPANKPAPKPAVNLTVGGSVSGLAGSGLVLQLNGKNDLAVSANGKFNFPLPLNRNDAYTVTVKTSPASPVSQTCMVSNGNGSIAAVPVSTVSVSCTTNTFVVGGKVSGLAGKGLVLQLNGANDIEIAKNGNFVFPNIRLPDGSDYSVTMKGMPPKLDCTMKAINFAPDNDTLDIVEVTCSRKKGRK